MWVGGERKGEWNGSEREIGKAQVNVSFPNRHTVTTVRQIPTQCRLHKFSAYPSWTHIPNIMYVHFDVFYIFRPASEWAVEKQSRYKCMKMWCMCHTWVRDESGFSVDSSVLNLSDPQLLSLLLHPLFSSSALCNNSEAIEWLSEWLGIVNGHNSHSHYLEIRRAAISIANQTKRKYT